MCSPLFYAEQWQLIFFVIEVYKHYGAELQVFYIQSILPEILDAMKVIT